MTLLASLLLCGPTLAEPVRFDWRLHAEDAAAADEQVVPPESEDAPNPVVLPMPKVEQEEQSSSGWQWLRPRIAGSPFSGSDRTAVQLADEAQEMAMAQRNSPLNEVLPGELSGLAPMAVESGIEWRF